LDKAAAPSRGITRSFGSYTVDHGLTGAVCTELKLGCVDGGPRTETRNHPSSSLCSGSQPFASTPVTSDVAIGGLDGNFSGRMSKSFLTFFFVYDSNLCVKRHEAGTTDVVHVSTQTHSYCLDTDESVFSTTVEEPPVLDDDDSTFCGGDRLSKGTWAEEGFEVIRVGLVSRIAAQILPRFRDQVGQ
jgi:hypothetical protein